MNLLIEGSTGPEVKNLQNALNYHLHKATPQLDPDGKFGTKTKARLIQFQTVRGLAKLDGKAGPETFGALYQFVELQSHIALIGQREGGASRFATTTLPPPAGPFQLPFPQPFRFPPPAPMTPKLEIDPRLLALLRIRKFELSAGQETSLERNLLNSDRERSLAVVSDLKLIAWQRPAGKHVEFSGGASFGVERVLRPEPATKFNALVFVKMEVKPFQSLGPLDIAKLEVEAQIAKKTGEPVQFGLSAGGGPSVEIEVREGHALSFGPGAFIEYQTNGAEHRLGGKFKLEFSYSF